MASSFQLSNMMQHNMSSLLQDLHTLRAHILTLSPVELIKYAALCGSAYTLGYTFIYLPVRFLYRVYFHPLRKVPGPKMPLFSIDINKLYTTYWRGKRRGDYLDDITELHRTYGPIVRTGPTFVHIADIETYNQIFKVATKFPKSVQFYNHPSTKDSLLDVIDFHEAHLRRNALQPYFSKQSVRKLEGLIQSKVTLLLDRIHTMNRIDISRGFRCLACDVITTYSYEKSFDALEEPNFAPEWLRAFESLIESTKIQEAFPTLFAFIGWFFMNFLSRDTVRKISPPMAHVLDFQDHCHDAVMVQKRKWDNGETDMVTIFAQLFQDDPKKGRKAATEAQLASDALLTVSAGMDTTGHTLTLATFHLVKNPDIQKRLLDELKAVMKTPRSDIKEEVLEQLPFLQAVIKESLRFGHGIPGPLPRDVPSTGANLLGYDLPPGTCVMNSHYMYHTNPTVYPEPFKFNPERWLAEDTKEQEKYFMPFSRGARICVGMNLAWAELELTVARLFRRYEISFDKDFKDENMNWRALFVPVTDGPLLINVKERNE
ncbi:hypothetical protein H072_8765 [Dactylellina haptotyla CBS 200.50]|uniref:Cytochrome P450 n=1 Tax=Dactylellina haptotyla (strain CBS 200.50) TaxID=1284197 RepID=S8A440_DACHA|nr:hypothetical protein H072_8765 [Dactylellina haptotyla CBS 200.50]